MTTDSIRWKGCCPEWLWSWGWTISGSCRWLRGISVCSVLPKEGASLANKKLRWHLLKQLKSDQGVTSFHQPQVQVTNRSTKDRCRLASIWAQDVSQHWVIPDPLKLRWKEDDAWQVNACVVHQPPASDCVVHSLWSALAVSTSGQRPSVPEGALARQTSDVHWTSQLRSRERWVWQCIPPLSFRGWWGRGLK